MKTLLKVVLFGAVLLWILGWAFDNTINAIVCIFDVNSVDKEW